jgi:DNA-binding CsgD family transcriptional regulator
LAPRSTIDPSSTRRDPLDSPAVFAFLEAAYQWDLDEGDWLRRVVEAAARVWGRPPFSFGLLYQGSRPCETTLVRPPCVQGEPAQQDQLTRALGHLLSTPVPLGGTGPAGYGRPAGVISEELRRLLAERSVPDIFFLHGREPQGSGCFVGLGAERTILAPEEAGVLRRLANHLSSACAGRRRFRAAREAGPAGVPESGVRVGLGLLTQREQQVVLGAASGKSTKEIAFELGISASTARVLLGRACWRLGVRSRAQLLTLPSVKALADLQPPFTGS